MKICNKKKGSVHMNSYFNILVCILNVRRNIDICVTQKDKQSQIITVTYAKETPKLREMLRKVIYKY